MGCKGFAGIFVGIRAKNGLERKFEGMKDIGAVIRERRKKLGLTKTDLAERAGTTRQLVCRMEKDADSVSFGKLKAVLYELYLEAELSINEAK